MSPSLTVIFIFVDILLLKTIYDTSFDLTENNSSNVSSEEYMNEGTPVYINLNVISNDIKFFYEFYRHLFTLVWSH